MDPKKTPLIIRISPLLGYLLSVSVYLLVVPAAEPHSISL
jgi:hypothetical protein